MDAGLVDYIQKTAARLPDPGFIFLILVVHHIHTF